MHVGRRVEAAGALITTMVSRVHGGKSKMEDYMPHEQSSREDYRATDEDVIRFFEGMKNGQ